MYKKSAVAVQQLKDQQKASFNISVSELTYGKLIGKGNFGEGKWRFAKMEVVVSGHRASSGVIGRHLIFFAVFVGEYRGTEVAIKKLMNQRMSTTEIAQFAQEVATMVNLRHPNILLFMGACAGML